MADMPATITINGVDYVTDEAAAANTREATAPLLAEIERLKKDNQFLNATVVHDDLRRELRERDATIADLRAQLADTFQVRVGPWMQACFGPEISSDRVERNHRFLEEALELVQSNGCTEDEASQLVTYVYGRDQGEINQEVGGVMVTLAALCLASGLDMHEAGETELARIWTKVEQIRAKQAAKPRNSPLPQQPRAGGRDDG